MPPHKSLFLSIPPEVTEHLLAFCHPRDVAAFSQTCHKAHALVYNPTDQYLWRHLFLSYPFDDPRRSINASNTLSSDPKALTSAPETFSPDWRHELQRRVHAEAIAHHGGDRHELFDVFLDAISNAAPLDSGNRTKPSATLTWVHNLLSTTPILNLFPILSEFQKLSHLHALLALSLTPGHGASASDRLRLLRRSSRTYVYDLRNYTEQGQWGPFCEGADRVDWMHVHAIVATIAMNLREFGAHWPRKFWPPALVEGLEATRAYSASEVFKRSERDWAGVEGYWMRIVCFCDYRDLIRFNASGCRPAFFDDDYEEASRLLCLNLRLTSVESDPAVLATLPDPSRPPLTFAGTMRGFNSDEVLDRALKGTIAVMPDGNIRWSFVSIYDGHDQWSSEGVQLGNVCSAAGIVGAWTGALHEHGDPSGPFWLFKTYVQTAKEAWPE
ncbi:hypothetical protein EW146_g7328 [Bondarzewia mesenterica]|uniref:F-box domain-containing protein n=1 Tax=Bondarzewia mesenterica TaxID=1095465 RepID=A0A4S4LLP6_9AGAM|nr:hypothetical protein EW146_g7328 [Bondarzewia mesenterica]